VLIGAIRGQPFLPQAKYIDEQEYCPADSAEGRKEVIVFISDLCGLICIC
jgi:hypothetical protein